MKYQDLIDYYGSEIKAAVGIGVSQATINNWKRKDIPQFKQIAIQAITKNKLKAEPKESA